MVKVQEERHMKSPEMAELWFELPTPLMSRAVIE